MDTHCITSTLLTGVSPVELLTLGALPASEAWTAVTLTCELQTTQTLSVF